MSPALHEIKSGTPARRMIPSGVIMAMASWEIPASNGHLKGEIIELYVINISIYIVDLTTKGYHGVAKHANTV